MNSQEQQLLEKFRDKDYRDAFVAAQIYSRLPLKIRALREDRELTQAELGERAGVAQAWVSKLEDPNYGKLTISTLLKIASACDVALHVDFVPYSYVLKNSTTLDRESFSVPSYEQDTGLWPEQVVTVQELIPANLTQTFGYWAEPDDAFQWPIASQRMAINFASIGPGFIGLPTPESALRTNLTTTYGGIWQPIDFTENKLTINLPQPPLPPAEAKVIQMPPPKKRLTRESSPYELIAAEG